MSDIHAEKSRSLSVGVVGARGYVGGELLRLVQGHRQLDLAFASSRSLAGQACGDLHYENLSAQEVASRAVDVIVLALPNGMAPTYVAELDAQQHPALIIDLGADYRFDADWHYGLPETGHAPAAGCRRISNPGCYATAMQLALHPLRGWLDGALAPPSCFGVSGYSGAGTTPSDKNDPEQLADNLLAYAATGHVHEREVTRHLNHAVHFMPHVAAFFRGILMTCNVTLRDVPDPQEMQAACQQAYGDAALVSVSSNAPQPKLLAGKNGAVVGGLSVAGNRLVIYSALDNLLKGAAVQALQNINLALGLNELEGIAHA